LDTFLFSKTIDLEMYRVGPLANHPIAMDARPRER
jgi:hypothetical protein